MFVYTFFLQFGDQILHKHPVFTMFTGDKDILGPRITSPLCGPRKALMNDATWFGGVTQRKIPVVSTAENASCSCGMHEASKWDDL